MLTFFASRDLVQILQVEHAVDIGERSMLAIIAALHDRLRDMGEVEPWLA